jgi:hypothetical protein
MLSKVGIINLFLLKKYALLIEVENSKFIFNI